jgi:hypothetical protein
VQVGPADARADHGQDDMAGVGARIGALAQADVAYARRELRQADQSAPETRA